MKLVEDLGIMHPKENSKYKVRFGIYLCECGKKFKARTPDVKSNKIKSCGCFRRELRIRNNTTHGDKGTRLYNAWTNIKIRCNYKSFKQYNNYGGRGISICKEWNKYENFKSWAIASGYKENLSIERVDVDGNYCPENCIWIPFSEQASNRRTSIKNRFTVDELSEIVEMMDNFSFTEVSSLTGIGTKSLRNLRRGII